jgi:hypothetical protein
MFGRMTPPGYQPSELQVRIYMITTSCNNLTTGYLELDTAHRHELLQQADDDEATSRPRGTSK